MSNYVDLDCPTRILLGPGPSMVHPRVLRAMAHPLVGHLDPAFIHLMDEVQELLRFVFQTENRLTIPVSGTGSAGMEAALCNFVEPGDPVLIGVNGYFGERLCDMASRYGAEVRRLERPWGDVFSVEEVEESLRQKPAKLVVLVHAETSTGALQPMDGMAEAIHRHGGLFVMDCVTSLGGVPVTIDAWDVDVAYSGTQKCLSCPPGLAPLTVGYRAVEVLNGRQSPVANWYLDLSVLEKYWGAERTYHHTAPISMNYALREALLEEGFAVAVIARPMDNSDKMDWETQLELEPSFNGVFDIERMPWDQELEERKDYDLRDGDWGFLMWGMAPGQSNIEVYVDGEYVPRHRATVSVFDHGLVVGDGAFDRPAVVSGGR